jgi:hypothetical protein
MEAHAGTIGIPRGETTDAKPRRGRLTLLREIIRAYRREQVIRNHAASANRRLPSSLPGSEHTHLLPPKGY